jgi:5-methylcytosine-specific restriction endonuclease McrA
MVPCLGCGRPSQRSRCPACEPVHERVRRPGPRRRGLDSTYDRARAAVLAASRLCWLCGHEGADQADHVLPRVLGGMSTPANLRPAHGSAPCPTCKVRCNQVRGAQAR